MIKNYLMTSFRNLWKHFSYSLINITGLGLGLAVCILLFTWIRHELSHDRFNVHADRIYRASLEYGVGGTVARTSVSPNALLPALLTIPETEIGVRVYNPSAWNPFIVRYGEKMFQEEKFYFADSTFFEVFSYEIISGNPHKALAEPYSVVLTASMAKKYFGEQDPVGKILNINNTRDYTVTAIMKDVPSQSLMKFDFIGSFHSIRAGREEPTWWSANYQTFVMLQRGASLANLVNKTNDLVKKALADQITDENDYVRYNFMPLTDIYLRSDLDESEVVSDIRYIYIFSAVAVLILVIACINYINLATARAADRAKEVGVRKVVGAQRKQLFLQFIGESVLMTFFAFLLAFLLAQLLLPLFNDLTAQNIDHGVLWHPSFLLLTLLVLIVIALLSGAYPAFAITSFKPVSVLKGNFKSSSKGLWLRKSLVVFQFAISVVLITGTIIIVRQLDFIQAIKLGYDRENTIILPLDNQTSEVFEALSTELIRSGTALHVGRGSESPANIRGGYTINRADSQDPGVITTGLQVDEEYIPAMGIEIIEGRNFTEDDVTRLQRDTVYTFILNETALASLYIEPGEAIGKRVSMGGVRVGEIIGVAKDFHFSSLHTNISPLAIFPEAQQFSKLFIKLPAGNLPERVHAAGEIYGRLVQHRPFEFEFLDRQYAALYDNEQRLGSIFVVFASLAIVIACLGLVGLVSFSAAQKTKEIGIRKVLGATATGIVMLITRDFTRLVIVAIIIGLPVGYWAMNIWLEDFAYKTEIGIGPIVLSSLICIVIALGSAGYQAVKAALIDPARTLRSE